MVLSLVDPYEPYVAAQTSFSRLAPQGPSTQLVYATFGEGQRVLVPFVDTGIVYPGVGGQMGDPALLRYIWGIRFGGQGTLFVRALVDEVEVQRGYVVLEEDATQASYFQLPNGTAGYGIQLQITGSAWWRYYQIDWDPVVEGGQ